MKIVTTPTIDDHEHEVVGLVEANSTRAASAVKDSFAGVRDFFGGKSGSYKKMLSGLIEDAHSDLTAAAQSLGADAVVGLRTQLVPLGGSKMVALQAIGTAVKFKNP